MIRFLLAILLLMAFNTILFAQADSAYVKIQTQTETGFLVIDNDYNNCIEFQEGVSIRVPAKKLSIKVLSRYFKDIEIQDTFEKNQTKKHVLYPKFLIKESDQQTQSSYPRCFWDSNVFLISDYDSDIYLEDKKIGVENVRLSLKDSTYEITSVIGNRSSTKKIKATDNFQVIENYVRPEKSTIYRRSLLPGFAQFSKNEKIKGSSFIALSSALTISTLFSNNRVNQESSNYEELRTEYNTSTNPSRLLEIIEESERALDDIDRFKKVRNYSLIGLGVIYTLNIIDGIKPPKIGFRSNKVKVNPYLDFDRSMVPKANLKIDF